MTAPNIPNTPDWHEGPNLDENWQEAYSEEDGDE